MRQQAYRPGRPEPRGEGGRAEPDTYLATISGATYQPSKAGTPMVKVVWRIESGARTGMRHKGKEIWDRLAWGDRARWRLDLLCAAIGLTEEDEIIMDDDRSLKTAFVGTTARVTVGMNGKYLDVVEPFYAAADEADREAEAPPKPKPEPPEADPFGNPPSPGCPTDDIPF